MPAFPQTPAMRLPDRRGMSGRWDGDLKALAGFEARLNLNRVWERFMPSPVYVNRCAAVHSRTLREISSCTPSVIGDRAAASLIT